MNLLDIISAIALLTAVVIIIKFTADFFQGRRTGDQ